MSEKSRHPVSNRGRSLTSFGMMVIICFCLASFGAFAQEAIKKPEVPFRTDAGLITAEYYLATGKYTQAIDVTGGVLTRHPANADAFAYRGFAYQQLGDKKKAKENYQRALSIDPTHLGANRYLAGLYLADGKRAQAMEQMEAIRLLCAGTHCAELDELETEINNYKKEKP